MGDLLRKQVRQRMADDMATQIRLLKSELEHYGDCFDMLERGSILQLIKTAQIIEKFCRRR